MPAVASAAQRRAWVQQAAAVSGCSSVYGLQIVAHLLETSTKNKQATITSTTVMAMATATVAVRMKRSMAIEFLIMMLVP